MDSLDADMGTVSSLLDATAASPMFVPASSDMTHAFDLHGSATGHWLLDALMLAAVPLVLQFVLSGDGVVELWKRLRRILLGDDDDGFVFRDIEAKTTFGKYYCQDEEENRHGHLLQQAIMAHLTDMLQSKLRGKDVRYEMVSKEIEDADVAETLANNTKVKTDDDYFSGDDDSETQQYEMINRLRVGAMPKMGEWVEVQPRVFFQHSVSSGADDSGGDNTNGGGGGNDDGKDKAFRGADVTSLYRFKSDAKDGAKQIDALIDAAFVKFQVLELTKLANDTKKYMYVQTHQAAPASDDDDDNDKPKTPIVVYKRYALGEEKTFGNLFFDEKPALVQLLDNFLAHSGKFAIPGFPYKLGLLLHGPPGTGKTSLIKAVAQHTKRHIVTISLGKIKTNQELMNALFDLRFSVEGVALPVNMTFEDVVFVMEDIDCAASVVMARKQPANASRAARSGGRYRRASPSALANDKLNLSGLLNVLDGVIDCPGRIVIMTTNHPEKLDPALIRPGRVNKKLELGYMSRANVQTMVEYYSQAQFTPAQARALDAAMGAPGATPITPATVEALAAEFDDIDAIVDALAQVSRGGSTAAEAWTS